MSMSSNDRFPYYSREPIKIHPDHRICKKLPLRAMRTNSIISQARCFVKCYKAWTLLVYCPEGIALGRENVPLHV